MFSLSLKFVKFLNKLEVRYFQDHVADKCWLGISVISQGEVGRRKYSLIDFSCLCLRKLETTKSWGEMENMFSI